VKTPTTKALAVPHAASALVSQNASKDEKSRLKFYGEWLASRGLQWQDAPKLSEYLKYLETERGLAPATAAAHLGTIRGRYTTMLKNNDIRQMLYSQAPENATADDKKAFVDEYLTQLENSLSDPDAQVKLTKKQDKKHGRRLSEEQANALIDAPLQQPHSTPLMAIRDAAIIALMLCTGIREAELCALDVEDLRHTDETDAKTTALLVRHGKGDKERFIPYGELIIVLNIVDRWLNAAGITTGAVFRAVHKNGKSVRGTRLTTRAVNKVIARYGNGEVQPHDLRRTYARRLYEAGKAVLAIKENLGHSSYETTEKYIGELDLSARTPSMLYNLERLAATG
jgi:site-specific recombinase XerD